MESMYTPKQILMESAASKLFRKSDRENKGFIVKRDMQRMKEDISLTPEQLETVFETLDVDKNGYLTLDQFLKGFREYLVITSSDTTQITDYLEEQKKEDFNDELTATLDLIKGTNVLKTSAEELECICDHMRDRTGCQLPYWEMFLKDLHHDLQTYKENYVELEKLMKQKDVQHQNYVKKMFEEIENQLREEKEKEQYTEQFHKRIKEEMKVLRAELLLKDELLQQLSSECRELKIQLQKLQQQEEKISSLNCSLMDQQNYYEAELEEERLKRHQIQSMLDNIKRRFSIEKSQCFRDGFDLARKVIHIQEEGLLQQLQILEGMQRILTNKEKSNPT